MELNTPLERSVKDRLLVHGRDPAPQHPFSDGAIVNPEPGRNGLGAAAFGHNPLGRGFGRFILKRHLWTVPICPLFVKAALTTACQKVTLRG
jgi:hypothetical protein